MNYKQILLIYLVIFAADLILRIIMDFLNLSSLAQNSREVPSAFREHISPEEYGKSVKYSRAKIRTAIVFSLIDSIVLIALILSGLLGRIDLITSEITENTYVSGIVFIFAVSLIFYIAGLPSALYHQFRLEEAFGFNKMTPSLFLADQLKSLLVSALIMIPLLLALFWFLEAAGHLWWIIAALAFTAFQLLVNLVYPVLIAPLFNKFTPLEEGALKEILEDLTDKLGFKNSGVFIMDGSRRSRHSNAYFTGWGKSRRIVLFDTLVEELNEGQTAGVLAHEIGHYKLKHLVKGMAVSVIIIAAAFFAVEAVRDWLPLYEAFGFSRSSSHAVFVILVFASGPLTFLLQPLLNSWSRKHEYEADRFAATRSGYGKDLKEALIIMTRKNLSNLTPHPLYSFFHYSHPVAGERIKAIDSLLSEDVSD